MGFVYNSLHNRSGMDNFISGISDFVLFINVIILWYKILLPFWLYLSHLAHWYWISFSFSILLVKKLWILLNVLDALPDVNWKNYNSSGKINRQVTINFECNYNRFNFAIVSIGFSELNTKLPVTKTSTPFS